MAAAASTTTKLYRQFASSSFLLLQRGSSATFPPSLLRLPIRYLSSSSATPATHRWPEWDQFVEKLKAKGYFHGGEADGGAADGGWTDQNRVKNACLKFARERFDILRSLRKEEIQTIVECGCPSLLRKAVNSAKRLRAFLKLDEGDVCSACNLRGSCDRAYVIAKEDEGARTVDVMRILMSYAVDPVLQPEGDNFSVKEHVHESARKLLAELTKLSDTTIDPDLQAPAVQKSSQTEPSQKSRKVTFRNKSKQEVEMKRGDWVCSKCNFLNFARNVRCLECKEDGPKRVDFAGAEMKLGDWTCPQCDFMNYARNKKCFRCQEVRPKRQLNPGEWECPSCDFVNFRGNKICKKCDLACPQDDTSSQFDDHTWRTPKKVKESKALTFIKDTDDEEDFDDDGEDEILPLREGENNFMASKRATPSERRFTSATKKTSPSL